MAIAVVFELVYLRIAWLGNVANAINFTATEHHGIKEEAQQTLLWQLFRARSGYVHHETFSFMMSLSATSFGDRFCFSRKGGIGGGGWVYPKGANSMTTSGLVSRINLVGSKGGGGGGIFVLFGLNGVRNKQSHLVGPPFPALKAHFSYGRLAFLERLI